MRARALLLAWIALAGVAHAALSDTINPVPSPNASFQGNLQTFLKNEDAQRFNEQFQGFVVSGCLGITKAGLTHTPSSCIAYPGGFRATETGSVTYSDATTCFTIVHKDTVGNLTTNVTWTRSPGTHYLTNCSNVVLPTIPADSVLLMRVVTSGGSITAVDDLRVTWPVKARPVDCVNPREPPYYAQGGGNADTTAAVQGAIDAVYNAGGGTVCLPRGHYLVTFGTTVGLASSKAALILKSKVVLRCDNEAVLQADTAPAVGSSRVILAIGDGVNDHTHMGVEGCTIDGLYSSPSDSGESYFGMSILNSAGHTVDGVRLINNEVRYVHGDGISSGQVAIGGVTKNVIISANNIHDDIGQAISEGNGSAGDTYVNFAITGNNLHDTNNPTTTSGPEAVIFSPGVNFVSFVGNTVAQWGEVSVVGASNMNISSNTIHGVHAPNIGHQGGITLAGSNDISNLTVDGNTIDVSDYDATTVPAGIFVNTTGAATLSQVTINGNTIKRGQAIAAGGTVSGIIVSTPVATGLTIVGNTIFNGLDDPTHLGADIEVIMSSAGVASKNITIGNNNLESTSTAIFVAGTATARPLNLAINGNVANGGGFLVQNVDGVNIGGNVIRETTKLINTGENSGITCLGCTNGSVINGNKVQVAAAAAIGIRLRGATANAIISHNTINLPGGGGIKQYDEVSAEGVTTNKWIDNEALQTQNFTLDTNSTMIDHINGNVWGAGFPALAATSQRYCSDCVRAGACAAGGMGAMALRDGGGAWICQW